MGERIGARVEKTSQPAQEEGYCDSASGEDSPEHAHSTYNGRESRGDQ